MSTLGLLFHGERIKWRRSWATVASVLPPLCQVGFLFLIFWFSDIQVRNLGPGFQIWYQVNYAAWNIIFMPTTVALVSLLSWDQEEEAGAWKHMLLQPVPRSAHFLAKFISHGALLLISQIVFMGGVVLSGILLKHASLVEMGQPRLDLLMRMALFSFLATHPLVGFHTWLSTRWRGLGPALGTALIGSLLTVLLVAKIPLARWMPWGMAAHGVGLGINGIHGAWWLVLGSQLVAALLIVLGSLDFSLREEQR